MKILFICTHNRCRSVLFEAIANSRGQGVIEAKSAGSDPAGEVHPLTLKHLQAAGIDTNGLRSQSWDDYSDFAPDLVITVCDSAAGETCPVWFGQSLKVHWGLEDPSARDGSDEEVADNFDKTIDIIAKRVDKLLEVAKLDKTLWPEVLNRLGAQCR